MLGVHIAARSDLKMTILEAKLRAANVRGKNIAVLIVFVSRQIVSNTRNMSTLDMARYVVGPSYPVLMLMNWSMIP